MRVETRWTRTGHKIAAAVITGTLAITAAPLTTPGAVAAAPAKSVRLGPVTGLQASATKPAGTYLVTTTWNKLAAAAAYQVTMTNPATGAVINQARVTASTWEVSTGLPATTTLSVKVVPLTDANRRGRAATTSVVLPDLTAPTGGFKADDDTWTGVITQLTAPADDVSASAAIVREVDWGNGFVTWTEGDTVTSTYSVEGIYHPVVRLTDAAGNSRSYTLTLVIGDTTAPVGAFSVTPAEGWIGLTRVALGQVSLSDDFSAPEDIERWVIWGDGTAPVRWSGAGTLTHVYRTAGSRVPVVRLVDQAGNTVEVETAAVLSKADTAAPTVTVRVPKLRVRYVATWRAVRGTAKDLAGTGVATVRVRAIEKRGAAWFAYRAPSRTWVKAGTKAAALRQSRPVMVAPTATGAWTSRIANLRKGTLVLKVQARDRAGNFSRITTVRKVLSR